MIIKGGTVCDKRGEQRADVRIENGLIKSVAKNLKPQKNEEVVDANGKYVLPGVVDLNSSLGLSNQNIAKTLHRVGSDAIRGGVSTIALQPKTPINTEIGLDYLVSKSKEMSLSGIYAISSAVENNEGDKLNNMAIMFKNGAVGTFLRSDANSNCIRRSMEYSAMYSKPVFVSLENKSLDLGGVMNDSEMAFSMGLAPFQSATEPSELAKICELSEGYKASTVVLSVSLARSVELAKRIKSRKETVQFCTDVHFFSVDDNECVGYNAFAKNRPPLRGEEDILAIKNAIKSGIISCVSSGHTPVNIGTKDVAFEDAAFGIESLALFLPICYTNLVKSGLISMSKLSEITSYNPAKIVGLDDIGIVRAGMKADLVIFDANATLTNSAISKFDGYSKGPYANKNLFGVVQSLYKNGVKVL